MDDFIFLAANEDNIKKRQILHAFFQLKLNQSVTEVKEMNERAQAYLDTQADRLIEWIHLITTATLEVLSKRKIDCTICVLKRYDLLICLRVNQKICCHDFSGA